MGLYGGVPLSHADGRIRLLHLRSAASSTDPVEAQLDVVDLDQAKGSYEALSYCWGKGGRNHEIKCNRHTFSVTNNLFQALTCLRRQNEDRTLWIDAICIDQESLEERAGQVRLMGDIYRNCSSVVVWLGPDPHADGVDHFFKLAEGSEKPTKLHVPEQWKQVYDGAAQEKEVISYQQTDSASNPPLPPDAVKGAVAAMKRAWWSRLWIIQELALPPSVVVVCGNLSLPWQVLRNGFLTALISYVEQASAEFEETHTSPSPITNHYLSIVHSRLMYTRPTEKSNSVLSAGLASLLRNHRWSAASDPRDKIYGLLGLADSTYGIVPRYDQPVSSCYVSATFSIIEGSRSLDILQSVGRPTCVTSSVDDLPSWVPDWSFDLESIPSSNRLADFSNPMHKDIWITTQEAMHANLLPRQQASGPEIRNFRPRLGCDPQHLILQGYMVDAVSLVGDRFEGGVAPLAEPVYNIRGKLLQRFEKMEQAGSVTNAIRGWDRIVQHHPGIRKGSEQTEEDAYLVTLLKNKIPSNMDRAERIQQMRTSKDLLTRKSFLEKTLRKLHLHGWHPRLYDALMGVRLEVSTSEDEIVVLGSAFINLLWAMDQRFGVTEGKCFTMLPASARQGDKIALFNGAKTPFVLRNKGNMWEMVGECYVHGIMSGEEWDEGRCVDMELC